MKYVLQSLLILLVCTTCIFAQQTDYQLEVLDLNTTQTSQGEILGTYPTPNGVYYHLETKDYYDELYLFKGDSAQLVFREISVEVYFVADFNGGALFSIDRSEPDRYALFINDTDGSSINLPIAGSIIRADFMEETQRLAFLTNRRLLGSISGEDNLIDTITTDLVSPSASFLRYGATSERILYQKELTVFSTDGTSNGTTSILEFDSAQGSISEPVSSGEKIYFVSNQDLHVTDGTTEGTVQLSSDSETNGLLTLSTIGKIYPFKGGVAFTAISPNEGSELFLSDGTPEGTRIIIDAAPGDSFGVPYSAVVNITDDYIMFNAWNTPISNTSILAISDGTESGKRFISEIASFGSDVNTLSLNLRIPETDDGDIYFVLDINDTGMMYGMNANIDNGNVYLIDQAPNSFFSFGEYSLLNDNLIYSLGVNSTILKSIESPSFAPVEIGSFDLFFDIKAIKDSIGYFSAQTGLNEGPGIELHRTDGTPEGTNLVKEIATSQLFSRRSFINLVNDEVYFTVDDQTSFEAIYTTDGTEEGTRQVVDFYPHTAGSRTPYLSSRNNALFIEVSTGAASSSLYSSLGDIENTTLYDYQEEKSWPVIGTHNQYTLHFKSASAFALKRSLNEPSVSIPMPPFTLSGSRISYSTEAAYFNGGFFLTRTDFLDNQRISMSLIRIDINTLEVETILQSEGFQNFSNFNLDIGYLDEKIVFLWHTGEERTSVWISDGTPDGTEQLASLEGLISGGNGTYTQLGVDKNVIAVSSVNASQTHTTVLAFKSSSTTPVASFTFPIRGVSIQGISVRDDIVILLIGDQIISINILEESGEILSDAQRLIFEKLPDGRVVFLLPITNGQFETWITDGTEGGTNLLVNNSPSDIFSDEPFSFLDNKLIFYRADTLFSYNFPTGSVEKITFDEVNPFSLSEFHSYRGRLYLTADNKIFGREVHYLDFNEGPTSSITGEIFHDQNANGQLDQEEPRIANIAVLAEGEFQQVTFSNTEGKYAFPLREDQNYTVSASSSQCWELTTNLGGYSILTESDTIYSANFGFTSISNAASIRPLFTMARPRCGFTIPAWVTLYNDGCQDLEYTAAAIMLPEGVSLISADSPPTIIGNSLNWEPGPLAAGESHVIHLELKMPGEEANGENIAINLHGTGIYELDISVETDFLFSQPLSCAIDPNDKRVTPSRAEPSNSNYTQNDETLTYTIRFQNTGTDTALNVRLEDQLSVLLDHRTFKPIAASHAYRASMDENGLVKVFFDNIMLPDSNANQTLSNGFFTFDVNAGPGLDDFTAINNTAGIFFDFNQPVITNTVNSTIVEFIDEDEDGFPFYEECDDENPDINPNRYDTPGNGIDEDCNGEDTAVSTTHPLSGQLSVFPNPAYQQLNLAFSDNRELVAQLYDLLGREHVQLVFRRNGTLPLAKLPAGTYLLKVTDVLKGETSVQRVIRR